MRRRRLLISIGLVLGFLATIVVALVALVKSDPSFYSQAEMAQSPQRSQLSEKAVAQWFAIFNSLSDPQWNLSFTADQMNAFFQEDYYKYGGDDNLFEGCSAPRVRIEDGKLRLGMRYWTGITSVVLSLEMKIWKVPQEINTLAMEIVSVQAGSLPLSSNIWVDRISEAARRENIDISWYRKEGHPVAVMRFQADLSRPTFQFDEIELKHGEIKMSGRSTDLAGPPLPRVVPKQ